ncbi:hypothetical protein KBW71_12975 [Hydrogenophaga aromaticivorans]|jgi:ElaB/YqjD/DUF883 family membrane-anchored ribosome-binding protein|uniref:DUF883 domain-containing protein n=1 Tax=Hydrogenophaga aromaticivorans TaxID=2610898 RepID=A0A7Y8KW57_9BURK|nr:MULTISPECIES: DUF883 domain-containing protein [Hydrogenophaga]EWS64588.1 hypothetical protein Y695_02168 [Hydrogenophaga sp. T4]MBH1979881.1 hypothetical protein [Comamonadaceae bacterium]MBU4184315.1 DUF883 domain-containing protein [Gammaproteobacteria bacterium]MBQ0919349.1 hypothetical protein [Hydrogenophaga aromaticivorans]MBU4280723.1 DUF883 domain-containing protein [Gammaproteobacteria bacterium]
MSESNTPSSTPKDKLIADIKQIVADADALLQATADQAGEKVAGLRTRLEANLKVASGRLAEFAAADVDKTRQDLRDALQKISDAANQAAEAASEAAQKAEDSVKKATESGKEAAQHAAEAARDAANKALNAITEMARKTKDAINK